MKQVVTESWKNDHVKIDLSYTFDSELVGKKQYQEVVSEKDGIKIVKYWIEVANNPVKSESIPKPKKETLQEKRQKAARERIASTQERVLKYRKMVESGQILFGCDRDDCFSF